MTSLLSKATSIIPKSVINLVNSTIQTGISAVVQNPTNTAVSVSTQLLNIADKVDQYNSLFVEAKDAIIFIDKINDWSAYIIRNKLYTCQKTWNEFMYSLYECTKYLEENYMNPKGQFFQSLIKNSNMVHDIYKKVNDDTLPPKTRMEKLKAFATSGFIYYTPNYYRQELGFRMLRVIELMQTVKFDMEMSNATNMNMCTNMGDKLRHLNIKPIDTSKQDIRSTIRILNNLKAEPQKGSGATKRKSKRR